LRILRSWYKLRTILRVTFSVRNYYLEIFYFFSLPGWSREKTMRQTTPLFAACVFLLS
jgi:hypothetical protein